MDQSYVNYGYTPVYHQLQSTALPQDPLPHFHHLTGRSSDQHQPLPSMANFNTATSSSSSQQQLRKLEKFESSDDSETYQSDYNSSFQPPPFYPAPIFNSHPHHTHHTHHQYQPMWENNFGYPTVISQYNFMPHRAPAVNYTNFLPAAQPSSVQVQVIGTSTQQLPQQSQMQQQQQQQLSEAFSCDICKRDFASAALLKRHVLTKAHVKAAVKSAGCIDLSELQERAAGQDSLIVKNGAKSFQVTFTELQTAASHASGSITDLSEAEVVLIDNIDKELSAIEPSTLACFEVAEERPKFALAQSPSQAHVSSSSSSDSGEFHCGECNKTFAKRCYLTQHNKTAHAGAKPFKCAKCGKKFPSQPLLDEHVQKHGGEKPFKCTQCPKSFNFKTDLKRHVILHTAEKPHVCQQCGKGFIRNDHLMKHLVSHKKKMEKLKRICSANGVAF